MFIIGCDFRSRFQQIAMLDPATGEVIKRWLEYENGEAKKFSCHASESGPSRDGSYQRCSVVRRNAARTPHELWVGDAAEIRAAMVRKQKTDPRGRPHILDLLLTLPPDLGPVADERDLSQMPRHRHKLVRFRASVMNQLHASAAGQGL